MHQGHYALLRKILYGNDTFVVTLLDTEHTCIEHTMDIWSILNQNYDRSTRPLPARLRFPTFFPSLFSAFLVGGAFDRVWGHCVDIFRGVHGFDGLFERCAHDGTLRLQRWRQLASLDRKVARQDGKLLHLCSIHRASSAVSVGGSDGFGNQLDESFRLLCFRDLFDRCVDSRGSAVELVSARGFAGGANGLQGDQSDVELSLVANHQEVGDCRAQLFHAVLERDWGNVLAAGTDDELLVPSGDLDHAPLVNGALVAGVEPSFAVDGFRELLVDGGHVLFAERWVSHVAKHDVTATEAHLSLLVLGQLAQIVGTRAFNFLVDVSLVDLEDLDLRNASVDDVITSQIATAQLSALKQCNPKGMGGGGGATNTSRKDSRPLLLLSCTVHKLRYGTRDCN